MHMYLNSQSLKCFRIRDLGLWQKGRGLGQTREEQLVSAGEECKSKASKDKGKGKVRIVRGGRECQGQVGYSVLSIVGFRLEGCMVTTNNLKI